MVQNSNLRGASAMAALSVRELHISFRNDPVPCGIELHVQPGEMGFVPGPSGPDKSTMLRCGNRLQEPDFDEIFIEGDRLTGPGFDLNMMRKRIGIGFQSLNLHQHLLAPDPELAGDVLDMMRAVKAPGMTMPVVSHEMKFAQDAEDCVIFMNGARIVDQGPPDQIFGAPTQQCTSAFLSRFHG